MPFGAFFNLVLYSKGVTLMFLVLSSIPMGSRHHVNLYIRGRRNATAIVYLKKFEDGFFRYGVGILYPDKERSFLKESTTLDPKLLWRGMYAASRLSCLSDLSLAIAVSIADVSVPIDHPQFTSEHCSLLYEYHHNAEKLRAETMAQIIPESDIKKISMEFRRWGVATEDSFTEPSVKNNHHEGESGVWGFFEKILPGGTSFGVAG